MNPRRPVREQVVHLGPFRRMVRGLRPRLAGVYSGYDDYNLKINRLDATGKMPVPHATASAPSDPDGSLKAVLQRLYSKAIATSRAPKSARPLDSWMRIPRLLAFDSHVGWSRYSE